MSRKYTTPKNIRQVRKRAWRTRREMYGERGHGSAYARRGECDGCARMTDLVVRLHIDGTLSEGQAARAIGCGRVELRVMADALMNGPMTIEQSGSPCDKEA